MGAVADTILGPAEPKWDAIALVRYPSFSALRQVTESPLYFEKPNLTVKLPSKLGSSLQHSNLVLDPRMIGFSPDGMREADCFRG